MARKTHEQFKHEITIKHPNIEILNEYVTSRTMIEYHCKLDGHRDKRRADNLLTMGCHVCSGYKKTHEQFIKGFHKKNPNAKNIEVLGEYQGSHIPIHCKCKIDGYEWSPTPECLENRGQGCLMCAIRNSCGENNPNYNFNKTDEEREKNREYLLYDRWVTNVYKKDNYTCQCCGQYGGKLNAHHKDGHNWCIERRLDVTNGVVLCEDCYDVFHKIYGRGNNTEQQFIEFINKYKNQKVIAKIACITTNKIFNTIKEAMEFYNIKTNHISDCCKGNRKSCGELKDGTKLQWKYEFIIDKI